MSIMRPRFVMLLVCAVLLLWSQGAFGYVCLRTGSASDAPCQHWDQNTTTLRSLLGSAGGVLSNGTTTWDQNGQSAANDWSSVGSNFHYSFEFGGTQPPLCLCPNPGTSGVTPVLFASSTCSSGGFGDIVAETVNCYSTSSGALDSSAVFVNANASWNAYDGALRPPTYDIRRVLLHEFGHVLGLAHPDAFGQEVVAIMNSRVSDLDGLQADDINGVFSLYPTGPSPSGSNTGCQLAPAAVPSPWLWASVAAALGLLWRRT